MSRKGLSKVSFYMVIFSSIMVISGIVTWRLMNIPFGGLFETFLALTAAGMAGVFITATIVMLRARWFMLRLSSVIPGLLAVAIVLGSVVLKADYRLIPGLSYRHDLAPSEWIEDLEYLSEKMEERHPRLFEMIDRERFSAEVAEFKKNIPGMDDMAVKAGLCRTVALPRDAHCFPNIYTHKLDWHLLPFKLWLFGDELVVLDSGREYRETVGTSIVRIGSSTVEDAYEVLRSYLSAENEYGWKNRFLNCVSVSEWLKDSGIVNDARSVELTFRRKDGSLFSRQVKPVHYIPVIYWSAMEKIDNGLSYILPNDRRDNYWFEYLADSGTLYLQFNACQRVSEKETIDRFCERLGDWIETNDFERLVIDVRKNDGGDASVSRAIAKVITGNEKVDRPGKLFALTSRKTFSAAVMFLSLLRYNTKVIIAGEPTGQGEFFCGGPRTIELPNSGYELLVSSHYNRCAPFNDGSSSIEPDIEIDYTFEDYLAGRDPALDAVISYIPAERASVAIEDGIAERFTGRYGLSPYQIITVSGDSSMATFAIDDFMEGSYNNARSELYYEGEGRFSTDIDGVYLIFDVATPDAVTLDWRGRQIRADRVPDDFRLPMELFAEGKTGEAVDAIFSDRETYMTKVPFLESRLNFMGYALVREERFDEAISIFELNVRLYPESANVYDSLGEGYLLAGKLQLSAENYRKACELNPHNARAKDILKKIEGGMSYDMKSGKWTG